MINLKEAICNSKVRLATIHRFTIIRRILESKLEVSIKIITTRPRESPWLILIMKYRIVVVLSEQKLVAELLKFIFIRLKTEERKLHQENLKIWKHMDRLLHQLVLLNYHRCNHTWCHLNKENKKEQAQRTYLKTLVVQEIRNYS